MKDKPSTHTNKSVPTVANLIDVLQRCYHPSQPIAFSLWSLEDVRDRLADMSDDEDATVSDQDAADLLEMFHDDIAENHDGDRLDSLIMSRLFHE
jgi:hypothetical protein